MNQITARVTDRQDWSTAFPTRKQEEYKYLNLKELRETPWELGQELPVATDLRALIQEEVVEGFKTLVMVDGNLVPELSTAIQSTSIEVMELKRALSNPSWSEWYRSQSQQLKDLGAAHDFFDELGESYLERGVVLRIPANYEREVKLQIISIVGGLKDLANFAPYQIWMDLGEASKASVLERQLTAPFAQGRTWLQPQIHVSVGRNASLEWTSVQNLGSQDFSVGRSRFIVNESASLKSLELSAGAKIFRRNLDIHLVGKEAHAELNGLSMTGKGQTCDFHTLVDHKVGYCTSNQLYKGVLGPGSQSVFNGKVLIRKGSQKASSEQLNKNLLLSSTAEVDSKPELEIHADDVKATHGSAIGQLNEDEIFYLQSRAISAAKAREMLALGFVEDLVMGLTHTEMVDKIKPMLRNSFAEIGKALSEG